MKYLLIILIFLFSVFTNIENLFSQISQQWVSRYNGPANLRESAFSIAVDDSGNVYVSGNSYNTITLYDLIVIKYNSSGVEQWVRKYNGPGNSQDGATALAIDNTGNIVVTGYSYGSGSSSDFVTIKYNANGDSLWLKRYNGASNGFDIANAIAIDASGNICVTGQSFGSTSAADFATIKYKPNGDTLWVKKYSGPGNNQDQTYDIAIDALENVYVTGSSVGTGTQDDYVTIKYNAEGVQQWLQRYNITGNVEDFPYSIGVDNNGNVFVTGRSQGVGTSRDYATIKYNTSGVQQWIKRYNGTGNSVDEAYCLALDTSGNIYVSGISGGTGTSGDYATIKYNTDGDSLWIKRYNGPGNGNDGATAMKVDVSGNVYITGNSQGPGTNYDYVTIKYNSNGDSLSVNRYNGPGNNIDFSQGIAVDISGNFYVIGYSVGIGTDYDFATIKYSEQSVKILYLTAFVEGFYNPSNNSMYSDTVMVYLRNDSSPYFIIDSVKGVLDNSGYGTFNFSNAVNGTNYYLELKHRNSISTWSASGVSFSNSLLNYDFSDLVSRAYGNNMKQIDSAPDKFAIFSGDVDQDGLIDASDLSDADNDAAVSLSGYVNTDVTGDDYVDAEDISIVENNVGVIKVTPFVISN